MYRVVFNLDIGLTVTVLLLVIRTSDCVYTTHRLSVELIRKWISKCEVEFATVVRPGSLEPELNCNCCAPRLLATLPNCNCCAPWLLATRVKFTTKLRVRSRKPGVGGGEGGGGGGGGGHNVLCRILPDLCFSYNRRFIPRCREPRNA